MGKRGRARFAWLAVVVLIAIVAATSLTTSAGDRANAANPTTPPTAARQVDQALVDELQASYEINPGQVLDRPGLIIGATPAILV